MKIVCESLDEYDKLMRASKYLHDFRITHEDHIFFFFVKEYIDENNI